MLSWVKPSIFAGDHFLRDPMTHEGSQVTVLGKLGLRLNTPLRNLTINEWYPIVKFLSIVKEEIALPATYKVLYFLPSSNRRFKISDILFTVGVKELFFFLLQNEHHLFI